MTDEQHIMIIKQALEQGVFKESVAVESIEFLFEYIELGRLPVSTGRRDIERLEAEIGVLKEIISGQREVLERQSKAIDSVIGAIDNAVLPGS